MCVCVCCMCAYDVLASFVYLSIGTETDGSVALVCLTNAHAKANGLAQLGGPGTFQRLDNRKAFIKIAQFHRSFAHPFAVPRGAFLD